MIRTLTPRSGIVNTKAAHKQVFVDHYKILGLPLDASEDEVKKTFRRLALRHHPDTSGEDGLVFLAVYNAYRILTDMARREEYDLQYRRHLQRMRQERVEQAALRIPVSRLVFPQNVATLARKGLLRRELRSRDRRFHLRINFDVELPLAKSELNQPIRISLPLTVRSLCPVCAGSDLHCTACHGRGTCQSGRLLELTLEGGLTGGQIVEVNLEGLRPEPLAHYKKKKIRIKISVREPK